MGRASARRMYDFIKQPNFSNSQNIQTETNLQNISSRLAARCARVVEKTSAPEGVVTPPRGDLDNDIRMDI